LVCHILYTPSENEVISYKLLENKEHVKLTFCPSYSTLPLSSSSERLLLLIRW
jgi:hypothetical protein